LARSRDGKGAGGCFCRYGLFNRWLTYRFTERTQMIKIKSRGNETAEQMIRRFKKMCEKEGLTKDIKRVAYYEKPSEKRRRQIRSKPRLKPVGR
jgi:small subunit ribosomal protein S21